MNNADEEARKRYSEAGVDLPELKEDRDEKTEKPEAEKPKPTVEKPDAPPAKTKEETEESEESKEDAPLQDKPPEQRKRSIYDDYKDKKSELKTEKERREQLERDNADLKAKLDAVGKADTPEEKKEAADDLDAFAKKINADPAAIREMRDLFLKDAKPATDEALAKSLAEFQQWKAANSQQLEQAAFDKEFETSAPKFKELFPTASPEELGSIKKELDVISHTKEWHDKSLAYIAFEHKDKLTALISPKKRGIEGTGRKADADNSTFEFNPDADYASMSAKEREAWETAYKAAGKSEGLMTGADGKKYIL